MKLLIKKLHPDVKLPQRTTAGSACFDLCAFTTERLGEPKGVDYNWSLDILKDNPVIFGTGLSFAIPEGYVMLIFSRSGHGFKEGIRLSNCVGVIDSDYRGEVKVKLTKDDHGLSSAIYKGDRIAQAMILPLPVVELEEVEELDETSRGTGGLGSTGVH